MSVMDFANRAARIGGIFSGNPIFGRYLSAGMFDVAIYRVQAWWFGRVKQKLGLELFQPGGYSSLMFSITTDGSPFHKPPPLLLQAPYMGNFSVNV